MFIALQSSMKAFLMRLESALHGSEPHLLAQWWEEHGSWSRSEGGYKCLIQTPPCGGFLQTKSYLREENNLKSQKKGKNMYLKILKTSYKCLHLFYPVALCHVIFCFIGSLFFSGCWAISREPSQVKHCLVISVHTASMLKSSQFCLKLTSNKRARKMRT